MNENSMNKQSDQPKSNEVQKSAADLSKAEPEQTQELQAEKEESLFDDRSPKIQDRDL